jgi:hypothetical protein
MLSDKLLIHLSLIDSMKQYEDNASRGMRINPWYKPSLPHIIKPIPILEMPSMIPIKLVTLKAGRLTPWMKEIEY